MTHDITVHASRERERERDLLSGGVVNTVYSNERSRVNERTRKNEKRQRHVFSSLSSFMPFTTSFHCCFIYLSLPALVNPLSLCRHLRCSVSLSLTFVCSCLHTPEAYYCNRFRWCSIFRKLMTCMTCAYTHLTVVLFVLLHWPSLVELCFQQA